MKSVIFCFATHNHQPIGNFDNIIEEAYQRSYLPFFKMAEKTSIRYATHFTGILLNWIEAHHPEHIVRLRRMVERGQLEFISGGFYEPILSVIPPEDQQSQIAMLSGKIRDLFGYDPTGMWLAERVWEQPLASALNEAGMKYVLLDDTHFLYAGLAEDALNGYYLTEDRGRPLAVFPISKALRYTVPFKNVDDTIAVLRDASSDGGTNIVCFADDGEKFGVWPQTFEHVYGDGWLEEFFRKLDENRSWIKMMHPSEALRAAPPVGRIYLPNASYAEMTQWALPTAKANQQYENFLHELNQDKAKWEQFLPFVRGGYWRNFFAKYPETNQLHKHMLRTSTRVQRLSFAGVNVDDARNALLSAQCNDPYWHGVFGGAYLPNLRHANFSALVQADGLLDTLENANEVRTETTDFDCDGEDEVIMESKVFSLFIKPSLGGMIAELDFKHRNFNATNIFSRQAEAYHEKIINAADSTEKPTDATSIHDLVLSKEAGLEKLLIYDSYRHGSMIEHFLSAETTLEELKSQKFEELGDFVTSAFERGFNDPAGTLRLSRLGNVNLQGELHPVRLTKVLSLTSEGNLLQVGYSLTNESQRALRLRFASEWAFNLLAGDAHDRYFESAGKQLNEPKMNSTGSVTGPCDLRLVDEYLRLAIDLRPENASEIFRYPLESVSLSEAGFERIYQGSILMPIWDIELQPGARWETTLVVAFELLS